MASNANAKEEGGTGDVKSFQKNFSKKSKNLKKFLVIFRYGESPSGKFEYSEVFARNKSSAWDTAVAQYGNYAPLEIVTEQSFEFKQIKALGATVFETLTEEEK